MKKIFLFAIILLFSQNLKAQNSPEPLTLEYICELKVKLKPALIVGETAHGLRRIIPIVGGSFEGPKNERGNIRWGSRLAACSERRCVRTRSSLSNKNR